MLTLLKNAHVFAPEDLGTKDILIANGVIEAIDDQLDVQGVEVEIIDCEGMRLIPGFIDGHVHITGGGGEGGFHTRTPEMPLSSATRCGVTTICGLCGTDGVTRSQENLLAKAYALENEGLTAYMYVGSYEVPTPTITGSIRSDIMLIDKCIGAGEIAVSDHRSSQPNYDLYRDIVAQVRVGGMLAGKAGIVNFHMGDGERGLEPLRQIANETEIPYTNMLPTHTNRNEHLFNEAVQYVKDGGYIDLTSCVSPELGSKHAVKPSKAIRRLIDEGCDMSHVLMSSDGYGSVPLFDDHGNNIGVGIRDQSSLMTEFRDAVETEGCDFATALSILTKNVADLFRFKNKGEIAVGKDADFMTINDRFELQKLWAKGRLMVDKGEPIVFGTFEKH